MRSRSYSVKCLGSSIHEAASYGTRRDWGNIGKLPFPDNFSRRKQFPNPFVIVLKYVREFHGKSGALTRMILGQHPLGNEATVAVLYNALTHACMYEIMLSSLVYCNQLPYTVCCWPLCVSYAHMYSCKAVLAVSYCRCTVHRVCYLSQLAGPCSMESVSDNPLFPTKSISPKIVQFPRHRRESTSLEPSDTTAEVHM